MTTTTALHTFALAASDPRLSPLAREIALDLARDKAAEEAARLRTVARLMESLAYGHAVEATPDLTAVLEEARGWVADCGYTGDAWALSDRQVSRIIARHVDGGIDGWVECCAALLP